MREKTISAEDFKEGARQAVLKALDEYMREITDCDIALGARDSDLPHLFRALDAHMDRVAERFNHPQSIEAGSAFFYIRY